MLLRHRNCWAVRHLHNRLRRCFVVSNRGYTSLKCKRRTNHPMSEYDRLPADLRGWLAEAILPWSVKSVRKAYMKAKSRTGSPAAALKELDRIEAKLIARDAAKVWGEVKPAA
ncbi:MAG: DUF6525 family protein [Pseudomonadota bacterium]